MEIVYYIIFIAYSLILIYILLYNLIQLELLVTYRKHKTQPQAIEKCQDRLVSSDLPLVTVQLPMYNEKYVAERLIDNICALHYPKEKLEIQVLDDSTDETLEISRRKVKEYRQKGFDIHLVPRKNRTGFKAGALQHGLRTAHGELIAIFDADFLPEPDFLQKTIPCFNNKNVGVVQTRWEHLNQNHSLITEVQAFQLNVHFTIEQSARCQADYMLQFNGTAGIWRKSTIEDAGGWQADTLTEDLDLSYRAQLKGWKILYREDIGAPAELPAEIFSYKSQQFRWMKGGAETARKLMPVIWHSNLPFWKKVHASAHLTASTIFLLIFSMAVLSVPMIWAINGLGIDMGYYLIFIIGVIAITFTFYQANVGNAYNQTKISYPRKIWRFLVLFPAFMALSMGLSLHNSLAVIQGYRGKKSPFIRTPKISLKNNVYSTSGYLNGQIDKGTMWEGFFCLYFIFGVIMGLLTQNYSMIVLHIFLATGFGLIFYYSLRSKISGY